MFEDPDVYNSLLRANSVSFEWIHAKFCVSQFDEKYNSSTLIRTPLLSSITVYTGEVSYSEKEHQCIHINWRGEGGELLPRFCVLSTEGPSKKKRR